MHSAEMGCKQMANYYAVVRSDSFLMHYGIKGMRWGARKAIAKGNKRLYDRYYKKASKRLRRLEKQANNGQKYARKTITKGIQVGNAAGLALMGIQNPGMLAYKAGVAGYNAYRSNNVRNGKAAEKAKLWRDEMNKEFNIDALYASQERHRHKKKKKR